MSKDHSDSERVIPMPSHVPLFPISSMMFSYMHQSTDRIRHTTAFGTPVVKHWLEREVPQG